VTIGLVATGLLGGDVFTYLDEVDQLAQCRHGEGDPQPGLGTSAQLVPFGGAVSHGNTSLERVPRDALDWQ